MKKNDIYSMYNDIDEMINSIDINAEDIIDEDEQVIVIDEEYDELDEIANNEFISEDEIEILDLDIDNKIELPDDLEKTMVFEPINDVNKEESSDLIENDQAINKENKLAEIDEIFNDKEEIIEEINEKKVKKEKNKKEKKKSNKKWVITFGILDIIAVVCLFLMYGPISYFRDLWVTSAMTTGTHQYLAYIFFNDDSIKEIMDNNKVIESGENTDENEINHSGEDTGVYESIYEEQVLKRTPGNDLYKVIDIEGDGYKGHMIVVYDPSRVTLFEVPNIKYGGKQMDKMIELAGAYAGINASGFSVNQNNGLAPVGTVIMGGKIVHNNGATGWGGGIIGFTKDNILVLTKSSASEAIKMGIRDAVSFGPFLIVNGEPSQFKGNGGYGIAPRTAIGQRKDGIVLLLVIDGRRPGHSLGVDMVELTNIMLKYGAYNASNLDGGGSSSMAVEGKIINVAGGSGYSGDRYLPNAWVVK